MAGCVQQACRHQFTGSRSRNIRHHGFRSPRAHPVIALPEVVSFNEHIQPILSDTCYHCHGPDSGTREPKKDNPCASTARNMPLPNATMAPSSSSPATLRRRK